MEDFTRRYTAFIHHRCLAGSFFYELEQFFLALCFEGPLQNQGVQALCVEPPTYHQDFFSSASSEADEEPTMMPCSPPPFILASAQSIHPSQLANTPPRQESFTFC